MSKSDSVQPDSHPSPAERYSASHDINSDELVQDAILRKLQLPTESSKRVSAECKAAYPQVRGANSLDSAMSSFMITSAFALSAFCRLS